MILDRVLEELTEASGPVRSSDLARRLDVSASALDGMIGVLVAKGRLSQPIDSGAQAVACSGGACGTRCVGLEECPFIARAPKTSSLVLAESAPGV